MVCLVSTSHLLLRTLMSLHAVRWQPYLATGLACTSAATRCAWLHLPALLLFCFNCCTATKIQTTRLWRCLSYYSVFGIHFFHNTECGCCAVLDIVGTGGDGIGSVNISTGACVLAAAAGAHVAKHGNRAVSSSCGAADVLEVIRLVHITDCPLHMLYYHNTRRHLANTLGEEIHLFSCKHHVCLCCVPTSLAWVCLLRFA